MAKAMAFTPLQIFSATDKKKPGEPGLEN